MTCSKVSTRSPSASGREHHTQQAPSRSRMRAIRSGRDRPAGMDAADVVARSLLALRDAIALRGGQRKARPYLEREIRRMGLD